MALFASSKPLPIKQTAVWQALPGSQSLFLSAPVREVCFAGTRGPGKTDAMLMSFAQYCGRGYGDYWRGVIFRRNYKHLDDIISKSKRWFNRSAQAPRFLAGSSSLKWVWPTGEELLLRAFEDAEDYWSYHGHEYPFVGWEELTSWPNIDCYESMKSCNRSSFQGTPQLPHLPRLIRSSTNPYGVGHCVPYGEVMTTKGWIDIKNVKVGDSVYSVDKTGATVVKQVQQVHSSHYVGKMVSRKARGLHMEFTPNHSLPRLNTTKGSSRTNYTLTPFNELPGQVDILRIGKFDGIALEDFTPPYFETRARKLQQPDFISGSDYAELMGWFLSEGHTCDRDKAFGISQTKQPHRDNIEALLKRCGFTYSTTKAAFVVYAADWWAYLKQFGKCRDKFVPEAIKNASAEHLQIFANAAMAGDGHTRGSGGSYYTLSKQLADDMAEIFVKLGNVVFMSGKYQGTGDKEWCHHISFGNGRDSVQLHTGNTVYNKTSNCASVNIEQQDFDGEVFCIGVPDTHTFFLRQNGCVWLSGNSWVKKYFIDPNPYGKITTDDEGNQRVALFGSVRENPYLGAEYIKTLQSITDANKRKAWLEGSWDITSGGMFDDLWDATKHVLKPFKVPYSWRVNRAFDWGSSKPFSVGWWATSDGTEATMPDGTTRSFPPKTLFRIGEWYGCTGKPNEGLHMTAKTVAQGILIRETKLGIANQVQPGPADSAIYAVTDEASIGQNMESEGVFWNPADKRPGSRKNGWELVRDRLDAVAKGEEKAGLYVFDTCRDFLRTVPSIARDARDADDIDTDAEDHICDEMRYMALSADYKAYRVKISGA